MKRIALLAACAAWYIWSDVVKVLPDLPKPGDLSFHLKAAQALLSGQTPYIDINYDYPPLAAFLAIPLASLDYLTARLVWFAISQACLLLAAYLVWRFLGKGREALCLVAVIWAFGGVARENFGLGQLGPMIVLLLTLAYTQRRMIGGFAVGFGFGLKFIPGVLGLPLLLGRRWKEIVGALIGGVIGLLLPWAALSGFAGPKSPIRADYWMGTPATLSWSVPSSVLRVLDPATKGKLLPHNWDVGAGTNSIHLSRPERLASACTAGALLLVGAVLVIALNRRPSGGQLHFAMAGLLSLALAASPISWAHYQVMQYPGIALLLHEFLRRKEWTALSLGAFGAAATYQLPVAVLTAYYHTYGGWTAESPATVYFWTNVTPAACLLLFGLHMHVYRRGIPCSLQTLYPS